MKRILHNPKSTVIFSEFKTEDEVNREVMVGKNDEVKGAANTSQAAINGAENELNVDEEKLNEAISINYTLGDRSFSYEEEEVSYNRDSNGDIKPEEDFIEIVEQDSFERLEAYKDRCPFLGLRKCILKVKITVSKV